MKAPKLHFLGVLHLFVFFSFSLIIYAQSEVVLSSTIGGGEHVSICAGDSFQLFLTGGNPLSTYEFYAKTASGTIQLLQPRSTETSYTPLNPSSGTIFYALHYENDSIRDPTSTNSITLTVESIPDAPHVSANIPGLYFCSNQQLEFSASGGVMYAFYVNDILFQASSALSTFIPPELNGPTIVTAEVFNASGCSTQVSTSIEEIDLTGGSIKGDQVIFGSQLPEELMNTEEAQLNSLAVSALSTVTYQWESSLDGEQWHDVLNAKAENYQPQNLVKTVFFRRKVEVFASGSSCVVFSNSILIQILSDEDEHCAAVLSVTVPFVQDVILCNSAIQGAIRIEVTGGNSPHQIQWELKDENGDWIALSHLNNLIYAQFLSAGMYRAHISSVVSSALQSCTLSVSTPEIKVEEQNLSIVSSEVTYDTSNCYETLESGIVSFQLINTLETQSSSQTTIDEPNIYLDKKQIPLNSSMLNFDHVSNRYQVTGISPGFHTLKVESSTVSFCSDEFLFEIEEIQPIQFSGQQFYTVDPCIGSIHLEIHTRDIQGGVPFEIDGESIYNLSWVYVPDENVSSSQTSTQTFVGYTIPFARPGQYFLTIRDKNNCTLKGGDALVIEISNDQAAPFDVRGALTNEQGDTVMLINDGCLDKAEHPGTIGVVIEKGVAPYSIQWLYKPLNSNSAFVLLGEYENATHLTNLIEGIYKMEVRSLFSDCSSVENPSPYYFTKEFRVERTPPVILQSSPIIAQDLCQGKAGNIILEIFNNLHEELFFRLGDELLDVVEIVAGQYYRLLVEKPLEEGVLEIGNATGCILERIPIDMKIGAANFFIEAESSLENNRIRLGEEVTFLNTSNTPYVRSEWNFGDGSDRIERDVISETLSPTIHRFLTEGSFSVQLKIFNTSGCYEEITKKISVGKGYSIHAPNAFTPNEDFINDHFRPLITGFVKANLSIYDYRGNLLYKEEIEEVDDQNPVGISFQGWNGATEKSKHKTFLYTMTGYLHDQTEVQDSGTFILIK